MDDTNYQVLQKGYGLKFLGASRTRTGLVCKTNKGFKELKKINGEEKRILFEFSAKEYLWYNGFRKVDRFIKTVEDKPFYSFNGTNYVLVDFFDGIEPDFLQENDIKKAVSALANMHSCSEGFKFNGGFSNIGRIPSVYEKRRSELLRIKKHIKHQSCYSSFDLIVIKNFSYYNNKAVEAIQMLKDCGYEDMSLKAAESNTLCHNAFKKENIKFNQFYDDIYIYGFGKCAYDIPAFDLAEFIRHCMKREDFDVKAIDLIFNSYNQVRNISCKDIEFIKAVLTFPAKFFKLLNGYYNKRRIYIGDTAALKLTETVENQHKTDDILKVIKDF